MKYNVMFKVKNHKLDLTYKLSPKYWSCITWMARTDIYANVKNTKNTIDTSSLTAKDLADIVIKNRKERKYSCTDIDLEEVNSTYNWRYIKTIDLDKEPDFYSIGDNEYEYQIVYNHELEVNEIRVDYICEIIEHENNEKLKSMYEEYCRLIEEYEIKERKEEKIQEEIRKKEEEKENKKITNRVKNFFRF
jgi:hypothetical protein